MKPDKINIPSIERAVIIPDTHFPFANEKQVARIIEIIGDIKPTVVVQIGDLMDMYSFSRFARSVNIMTPAEEVKAARAQAETMWRNVAKKAPKAARYQLVGNHSTTRILKTIAAKAPELESFLSGPADDLLSFDGVVSLASHRGEIHTPNEVFIHGWSCRPLFHAAYFNKSVVCGHTHVGGLWYRSSSGTPIYELNCGHVADTETLPLQYTETATSRWISGVGIIDKYGPRFVAL